MDIFDIHNVKVEKANASLHYRRFRKIARLFRLAELFLAVALLSWISTRLPFAIRISGEYFRQLLSVAVSPLFIFLVGNVIVLTLVLKSGQIAGNPTAGTDLYEEIVNNNSSNNNNNGIEEVVVDEIVYQDKRIVSEVLNFAKSIDENENEIRKNFDKPNHLLHRDDESVSDLDLKIYRRSRSENLTKSFLEVDKVSVKLKRSETEVGRRKCDDIPADSSSPAAETAVENVVDELSNEEFQKRIEGFIARQVRFHQEEKLAIVPTTTTTTHNFIQFLQ